MSKNRECPNQNARVFVAWRYALYVLLLGFSMLFLKTIILTAWENVSGFTVLHEEGTMG